jgi:hypothetical protein
MFARKCLSATLYMYVQLPVLVLFNSSYSSSSYVSLATGIYSVQWQALEADTKEL